MKVKTIKYGNVVLPKNPERLTVSEFYFISNYFNRFFQKTNTKKK